MNTFSKTFFVNLIVLLLFGIELGATSPYVVGKTQLTTYPGPDYHPSWSSEGTKIAFASDRYADFDIFIMNNDGTGLQRLTSQIGNEFYPSWSPDGAKIAFSTFSPSNIWVVNIDGTGLTRLTSDGESHSPAWSPDGFWIAFYSYRDKQKWWDANIYLMRPDGSNLIQLTSSSVPDGTPGWNPDRSKIVWNREVEPFANNSDIWIMDSDGGNKTALTTPTWRCEPDSNAHDLHATFSPDGQWIAFQSACQDPCQSCPTPPAPYDIWIMRCDGSYKHPLLVTDTTNEMLPAWSPDGLKMGIVSDEAGNPDIWVLDISMAWPVCKAFLTPDRLNVMRDAEHSFKIHVYPCDAMDVSVGDSAEVYVDADTSGSFDQDEKYDAKVSSTDVDGSATDIAIKVYCPDIVDNDPAVAIYSINNVPVVDTSDNQIDYLRLDTFSPRKHQTTGRNIIDQIALKQNHPNPFNPVTSIQFTVNSEQNCPIYITLRIYNIMGQLVRNLVEDELMPGENVVVWDGTDDEGQKVSSGVYFYRIKTGDVVQTKKMILMK